MSHNTLDQFDAALTDPNVSLPTGVNGGAGRFDIYRNNVSVRLIGALAETFPVVKRLVGEEFFTAMTQIYVRNNRPATPVLFEYGSTFADFVETFDPAQNVPYLADIARLERCWLNAYHSADTHPLGTDCLAKVPERHLDNLRLTLHPSLHLIRSDHPVFSIWQAHQISKEPELSAVPWQAEHLMIVRPELNVHVIQLSAADFHFYTGLKAGRSLGAICAALGKTPEFEPSTALATLFNVGAVIALDDQKYGNPT